MRELRVENEGLYKLVEMLEKGDELAAEAVER